MEDLSLTSHYPKKAHVHKYKISGGSQAFRSQMLQVSSSTPVGWGWGVPEEGVCWFMSPSQTRDCKQWLSLTEKLS